MSQPMLLAYIIFVTGACLWFYRRPALTSAAARGVFAFIALLPAIAFWFLTSPLVRFGYGYVVGAAAVSMAIGVGGWVVPSIHPQTRRFVLTGAIAGLLLFARVDRHLLKATWLRWPAIPTAALVPHTTADGLVVQMPREGDRVWNAPVPATPELDPHLRCERDSSGKVRRFFIE
jgi:hypothetical protein